MTTPGSANPYLTPRPLTDAHDLAVFECTSAEQTAWLRRHARQSHRSDSTRVFVVTQRGSEVVVAYYAIRMAEVAFADATGRLAKGQGRHPQPVVLLARLGVDRGHEGRGLGAGLLRHAFLKALEASAEIGCRAVAVHCESDEARGFYLRLVPAFEPSPTDPLHLLLLIKDLRASLRQDASPNPTARSAPGPSTLEFMAVVLPPFDKRNSLEDALVAATDDPSARGPFLRLLLAATVYVVGEASDPSGTPKPEGASAVGYGSSLALTSFEVREGVTAIPFYSSKWWLSGCLRSPARFLTVPARGLFEMSRGETLVLNWGAPWAKEFTPMEIENILDHAVVGKRITVEAPRAVTLWRPKVEPTALLAALTTVLAHHREVSAGYMGWMHDPESNTPPHCIIGLEGESDLEGAVADAAAAALWVSPSSPVDFFRLGPGDGSISGFLLTGGVRFYVREDA